MRIRIATLFFVLLMTGITGLGQTIVPGGYVSGTWDSTGNPYMIEGPITIHRDSALFIEEGCVLKFYDDAFLNVEGYINAIGTAADSIVFTAALNLWRGVRIDQTDTSFQGNLVFQYCSFSIAHGGDVFRDGGVFSVLDRDDISIFNSTFEYNYAFARGGAIYLQNADIQLKKVYFGNNSTSLFPGTGKGGAVFAIDSEYILEEITFFRNESSVAGALYAENTDLDLRGCSFIENVTDAGGGALVCHKSGSLLADRCIFAENSAGGSGGAIALLEAIDASFRNCEIRNNSSSGSALFLSDGGGVLVTPYGNDVDFINCKFTGNEAGDYGGGLYSASKSAMTGCLFYNNHAAIDNPEEGGGGAILQAQSDAFILNCTFSGNTASGSSSIYCEDGNMAMVNTILWDDTLSEEPKIYMSQIEDPASIYISYCDIEGAQGVIRGDGDYEIDWAEGNISSDPLFESFGTEFTLSNESPCIDTGQLGIYAGLLPLNDLAGNPRVFRGKIDLGCYENQFPFGIEEIPDNHDFLVYPNPARDHFYLRNESNILFVGSYSISDLSGRMIRSMNIHLRPGEGMRKSCAELPRGMYVLKLSSENYSSAFKLVIQE